MMKKTHDTTIATEKLQKRLADSGDLPSRRQAEQAIVAGRVTVNGQQAHVGQRVSLTDQIKVDGRPIGRQPVTRRGADCLLYYKPEGEICSRVDPDGRPTVFCRLPKLSRGRWVMIGRLDINSSGLLLFTSDGGLAHRLMHPKYQVEREYKVRVYGRIRNQHLSQMLRGVPLEEGEARFEDLISFGDSGDHACNHWFNVVVRQGRNRMVRRVWEHFGYQVSRLIRVRYGSVMLPEHLAPGQWQRCSAQQLRLDSDVAKS